MQLSMYEYMLLLFLNVVLISCGTAQNESEQLNFPTDTSSNKVKTVWTFLDSLGYQIDASEIPEEFILKKQHAVTLIDFPTYENGYLDEDGKKREL